MMNLETEHLSLTADLPLSDGSLLDSVQMSLAPLGHQSIYLDESIDLDLFEGLLRVKNNRRGSAIVIQTRPGQFATMPVSAKPLDSTSHRHNSSSHQPTVFTATGHRNDSALRTGPETDLEKVHEVRARETTMENQWETNGRQPLTRVSTDSLKPL